MPFFSPNINPSPLYCTQHPSRIPLRTHAVMLVPLLLLLAVAQARLIGPIPALPVRVEEIGLVDISLPPLFTPDSIPNFASPGVDIDDTDPSFFPDSPEPSFQISFSSTPSPSSTPTPYPIPSHSATPSHVSRATSAPLVTPSSTPVASPHQTSSPPFISIPPSQSYKPTNTPDLSPENDVDSDNTSNNRFNSSPNPPQNSPTTVSQISPTPDSTSSPSPTNPVVPLDTPRVTNDTDVSTESTQPSLRPDELPSRTPLPPPTMSQRTPCFPATATVQLADGSVIPMHQLKIGHVVHVGSARYSAVHMFTHRIHNVLQEFVLLTTESGRVLVVTGGHYVYVGRVLKPAREVRVGDCLPTGEGGLTCVNSVETVTRRGLYNPQTGSGDIVVDGIKASVYTEAVRPALAHAALLPLRVAFSLFGLSTQCADHGYPEFVPPNVRSLLAAR